VKAVRVRTAPRWLVRVVIAVVVVLALWAGLLYQVVQNPAVATPTKADAVVVLGPATADRVTEAVALMDHGLAHTLVISNARGHAKADALCHNPPTGWTVICFVPEPDTTRGEAEHIRGLVAAQGWSTLIVVTSRYHVSRARLIVKRCFNGQLEVVAAPEDVTFVQWVYQYAYQSLGYIRAALHPRC
jgi:uncharacterized SAM-binding protein YcdF (DUF218 family)